MLQRTSHFEAGSQHKCVPDQQKSRETFELMATHSFKMQKIFPKGFLWENPKKMHLLLLLCGRSLFDAPRPNNDTYAERLSRFRGRAQLHIKFRRTCPGNKILK